ncbi:MAG TPA: hypothetical protein VE444_09510 [Gaiellaceae bacterium]|jgi:hypothetical protein|nr:hypothetical protein [Gaiellaceae bacterium]
MSFLSKHAAAPRLLVLALTVLFALGAAGAASAEFPTKRSDPSIKGVFQEGQTLNGQTGQWLYDNGLGCGTECKYTYQWQRCNAAGAGCTDIQGATAYDYTLVAADVGSRVRFVEFIFKRDCGAHNTQTGTIECADITKNGVSFPSPVIAPKPVTTAQNTAVPTIQGTAMEDEVLRATGGTWTGQGTITNVIYWQRCSLGGEGCTTIDGPPSPTYRLTSADVGFRMRVVETATNEGGVAQAVSATTAAVVALRPTATRQTIAVTKVVLPHRLVLEQIVTKQTGSVVTLRVKVSDDRGFRISGVQVRVTPTGLLAGRAAAKLSNRDGWATFTYRATGAGRTYVYIEARKVGEAAQSGISTANLFAVRVR